MQIGLVREGESWGWYELEECVAASTRQQHRAYLLGASRQLLLGYGGPRRRMAVPTRAVLP